MWVCFDSISDEVWFHEMKVDILARKGNNDLIVEILYTHRVDNDKLSKIKKANRSAIEIDRLVSVNMRNCIQKLDILTNDGQSNDD